VDGHGRRRRALEGGGALAAMVAGYEQRAGGSVVLRCNSKEVEIGIERD
jgi:hypothetical protein